MKKLLTLSLSALLLWSCAKDSEVVAPSNSTMSVTFTSDITSRVDTGGFELNDVISVAAYSGTTALSSNTLYTYDGAIFNSDTPIEYETSDQELTFTAVYPAQEGSIMSFDFVVATDQRVDDAYEMSDLLTSSTSPTTERQPELSFYHRMSNIVINVVSDDDFSDAVLTFNAKNSVACDLSAATFEASGAASTIYSTTNSNIGFKAILAPQTVDANSEFATLTIGEKVYTWTLIEDLVFTTGRQYIFNWDVVTNDVSLTGVINDWGETDDEDMGSDVAYTRLSDYSSTSYPTDTDEWFIYDMYTTYDDFAGLRDALNAVSVYSSREISIGFTNITSVPEKAFYESSHSMTSLTRVSLPYVTKINASAFSYCSSLKTLSTPELIYIGVSAFYNCPSLESLNLSKVLTVGSSAFSCSNTTYQSPIESLVLESIIDVSESAFSGMKKLKSISLPSATTLARYCFAYCPSLQEVNIPNVTYVSGYSFNECTTLQSVSIPKATYIGKYTFNFCYDLMNLSIATEAVLTQCSETFGYQDTAIMTLTIGSANSHLVSGNVFKAPDGSGGYVEYTFYKIIVI